MWGVGGKREARGGEGGMQEPRIKIHDVLSPAGIQAVFPCTPATIFSPLAAFFQLDAEAESVLRIPENYYSIMSETE